MEGLSATQWIEIMVLGGLAGALGQTLRVVVGIKKTNDTAQAENRDLNSLIQPSKLVVSLIIGFAAGAFAAVANDPAAANFSAEKILAFAAAGYAGADFIEGFMSRVVPGTGTAAADAAKVRGSDGAVG
jgi:hypothetical protein